MPDSLSDNALSDYLRVLRTHWAMIALAVLICVAVAIVLSVLQTPTYLGEAALVFRDPSADLNAVGTPSAPTRTPVEVAALGAQTVESPRTLAAAKQSLRTPLSVSGLDAAVSAKAQSESNLVLVDATSEDPHFAARLANAVAQQAAAMQVAAERRRFADAASDLRRQLEQLGGAGKDPGTRSVYAARILSLRSLSKFAQPVEVSASAQVPSSPVSPKPVRNAALAGLLGLLLGTMLAFLRHSLDPKLRGAREIQQELRLAVVGHVREDAMGAPRLPSMNGGRQLAQLDLEAFRILRTNVELLDTNRDVSSVLVTSALPEEGKSTVAASLALASAAAGKRVLLLECDLRRPSLSDRLEIRRAPGLADYLTGAASPQEVVQHVDVGRAMGTSDENGHVRATSTAHLAHPLACVMAGTPTSRPTELLGTGRFRELLQEVASVYDLVVLDTPPLLPVADTLEILPYADALLLCVRDGQTTRGQAAGAKAALAHLPDRPTGLVVTGISKGHEGEYGYYSYADAYDAR